MAALSDRVSGGSCATLSLPLVLFVLYVASDAPGRIHCGGGKGKKQQHLVTLKNKSVSGTAASKPASFMRLDFIAACSVIHHLDLAH